MGLIALVARHLVAVSLLALVANLTGRRALLRLPFSSAEERAALCTALGLGVISLLLTGLAVAGQLRRGPILLLGLLLLAASHEVWRPWLRRPAVRLSPPRIGRAITLLLGGTAALGLLLFALYPPGGSDDISYHLPVASLFARTGHVLATPWLRFASLPRGGEMLFSLMLLFGDDLDAQLVQLLMLGLSALALYGYGASVASPRAGLWAALLWLGSPLSICLGTSCYVDIGLSLFTTAATVAVLIWRDQRRDAWLLVAGSMAGFAASTKYQGLWFVLLLAILILAVERRLRGAAIFVATATLLAAPWYVIGAALVGDPIYPLGGPLFGYSSWTADELQDHMAWWRSIGRGRSPAALLRLPWNLTFHPDAFKAESAVSPAYLLGLPALAVAVVRDARIRWLAALVAAYTLMWFSTAQLLRFLLPAMMLLALACALAAERAARRLPWQRALNFVVALALAAPGAWWLAHELRVRSWPPTTPAARDVYLDNMLTPYPAIRFLNQRHGDEYRLYAVTPLDAAKHYVRGQILGDWLGPGRFGWLYDAWATPRTLRDQLASMRVDFLLLPNHAPFFPAPTTPDFAAALKLVYSDELTSLYQLNQFAPSVAQPDCVPSGGDCTHHRGGVCCSHYCIYATDRCR